jgi:hypothetical protein
MRSRQRPERHNTNISSPGSSCDGLLLGRRSGGVGEGVRSDDEMSSCSSSSAVASALGKRTYRKIAGHTDHAASAAGLRRPLGSCCPLPVRRSAGCGADTDINTGTGTATASATDLQPLETVAELSRTRVGFTTADLWAEIMREMEEIERIASVSRNLEGVLVKRLRLASWRVRASSAELHQRTVAISAVASTMADLCCLRIRDGGFGGDYTRMDESEKMEITDKDKGPSNGLEHADVAYLRGMVRFLESEVSRLQETVKHG